MNPRTDISNESVRAAAAAWLVRRDRGLSAVEQREFEQWLAAPSHAAAFREIEGPFAALDRVAGLRPAAGGRPDPDFLLTRRRAVVAKRGNIRRVFGWVAGGAVAAGLALAVIYPTWKVSEAAPAVRGTVVRHTPERLVLPDGSTVEMKRGSTLEMAYSGSERRVRLRGGQAFFAVAKDPARPFIVETGKVAVRAVGTAFIVSASDAEVAVVVTEGRVRVHDIEGNTLVDEERPANAAASSAPGFPARADVTALVAGERVVIPVAEMKPAPVLAATPAVIEQASSWRKVWLEFSEMQLAEVIEEFNRHAAETGAAELRVANEATGRVLVSGKFRADGVEAFVRLLRSVFAIEATFAADGAVVLRKVS